MMRGDLLPRVISSESEKSFSLAVNKKREGIGKWETRYSIRSELTAFHLAIKKSPESSLVISFVCFRGAYQSYNRSMVLLL